MCYFSARIVSEILMQTFISVEGYQFFFHQVEFFRVSVHKSVNYSAKISVMT